VYWLVRLGESHARPRNYYCFHNYRTLIGVTVAYFTNKFSASRSTEEKIWELRRASYGLILTELAAVESVLDELDSVYCVMPHLTYRMRIMGEQELILNQPESIHR